MAPRDPVSKKKKYKQKEEKEEEEGGRKGIGEEQEEGEMGNHPLRVYVPSWDEKAQARAKATS